ncbi:MAG: sulfite exporter TauE/SafE family protein [Thermoleophilia bacterium]|nr:sulfite exporter TauE/SafE family protein [Thermoleophilia bacterium]
MAERLPSVTILAGIGLAGGFLSALFGVGGGIVVVPLLIVFARLDAKPATGTSLAAIGLTALFGAVAFSALGEVHWRDAALVGFPAMAGTVAGTWLQQRVSSRVLVLLFAAFLLVVAVRLFLG